MEIRIDKSFFIKLIIIVILCAACFCLGRFLRFSNKSGDAQDLINGITLTQETAEKIAQELNFGGAALESASAYSEAVLNGLDVLNNSNNKGRECIELLNEALTANKELTEKYKSLNTDPIEKELKKAYEQAAIYEKLLSEYESIGEEN